MSKQKRFFNSALASLLALGLAGSAYAGDKEKKEMTWFGQKAEGRWMIGVTGSSIQNSEAGFKDASNTGILLGYEFGRPIGGSGKAAIEFETTTSYDDGQITTDSVFQGNGEWDVDTMGLYFAYRTPGTVFFKAKGGVVQSKVTANVSGSSAELDDTSFAGGAGLGFRAGDHVNIEFEYTSNTGDNSLDVISLGGVVNF